MKNKINNCLYCNKKFTKQYSAQKYCSLQCANTQNNINRANQVKFPDKFNIFLAEFMGILYGDGCVSVYSTAIYLNSIVDKKYSLFVVKLAKNLFPGASVTIQYCKRAHMIIIQISAKMVSDYLKQIGFDKSRLIPQWIDKDLNFTYSFIRGLFDTEGSVGFKKFKGKTGNYLYKQLAFTNKNDNLLKFVSEKLEKFRLKPTMFSKKNIYISNPYNIKKFINIIGLHNPKLIQKISLKNIDGYIVKTGRGPQKYGGVRRTARQRS